MDPSLSEGIAALRFVFFDERIRAVFKPHDDGFSNAFESMMMRNKIVSDHPIDAAIHTLEMMIEGLTSHPEDYGEWWTQFMLMFMTYHVIVQLSVADKESDEFEPFLIYQQSKILRFCRDTISKTHPKEAKVLYEENKKTGFGYLRCTGNR
jgi:hypothetical protein